MEICIDFDGTCVTHDFPQVGTDIGAAPVLKELTNQGHRLILFTMRSDNPTAEKEIMRLTLSDAVQWFKTNDIPLYGIQKNPTQKHWTSSPKAYGHLYIDDAAMGCPLIKDVHSRPYVNWDVVREKLVEDGILV